MESKNPSNADDWITHTTRKKLAIEKTKAIMFSRKKTAIAPRPRLDI
jgi:hypothetical protein